MTRRRRRAIVITVGVFVILVPILWFVLRVYPGYAREAILEWSWRRQSVAALESARTPDELKDAVGRLGVFVPLADGSWVAISYNHTHGGGIVSLAIALDSEGGWWESREHFCGSLIGFRLWIEEQQSQAPDAEQTYEPMIYEAVELSELCYADDLDEARQVLARIGFTPVEQ